ncbi:transglycosylase SLT domain-containing protein, partial [Streptomyces griseofuscus]|uniref:transglycosylase SLT domain-containing protein n=1 Tax=Streptomyces griseofuscus TaxID=146922 RepID=UPI0033F5A7C0
LGVYEAYKHVGWFHTAVDVTFKALKVAALFVWDHGLKPLFNGLWSAIKVVGSVLVWLWKNVFVPAWNGIVFVMKIAIAIIAVVLIAPLVIAFRLIGKVASWLWTNVIKPTWNLIAQLAKWLWEKYLKPFFKNIWDAIKWVGDKFVWLYDHGVKPIFDWIADKAKWLYNKGIKPAFQHIWDAIKWVGDKFKWLYDHSVGPIVDWIAGKAKWLYEKGIKPQFDKIKSALKLVSDGFKIAKDAIKEAWDDVKNITKGPVNFIIDMVYSHGIKAVWDKVAGFVGLDKLPKAPKLLAAGGTIGDGWGTARPMKTNRPTAIVGEGNPRFPEFVIPTDPKYRTRAKSLWHAAGTQLLASGGILGSAWDWTKDTVGGAISKGVDWAKKAGDLMVHPSKVWNELVKPLIDNAKKHLGVAQMGKVLLKYPLKMVDGLKDDIVNAVTGGGGSSGSGGNIGGTIPSGKRRTIISQALAAAHVPPPGTLPQWLAGMNTLITRESGWNPKAVNLWDSNAAAGYPSSGLAQVIAPTFKANHVPGTSWDIFDPVANVASSVRYITRRYGDITNVQQANANMPPKGYDSGGWLMPGFTTTYNGTGKPEAVFTNEQWADIRAAKRAPSAPNVTVESHTYLGTQELTDVVDHRIVVREEQNAASLNTGRWV